jgi:hypothetical protein
VGWDIELVKLVREGGGIVATIVVVILFLRSNRAATLDLERIADRFTAETRGLAQSFQQQIQALMDQISLQQRAYQEQIRSLIDDHITVTRETVSAVRNLDATVRSVEVTVRELQSVVQEIADEKERRGREQG